MVEQISLLVVPDTAWGGGKKKYVHFTLYKENMDNNLALGTISSFLKRNSKAFRTAGRHILTIVHISCLVKNRNFLSKL